MISKFLSVPSEAPYEFILGYFSSSFPAALEPSDPSNLIEWMNHSHKPPCPHNMLFPQPRILFSFSVWKTSVYHSSLNLSIYSISIYRAHKCSKILLSNGSTRVKKESSQSQALIEL